LISIDYSSEFLIKCVDNGTKESYCICGSPLTVNEGYDKKNEYCVKKNHTVLATENQVTTTTVAAKVDPAPPAVVTTAPPAPTAAPVAPTAAPAPAPTAAPTTPKPSTITPVTVKPDPKPNPEPKPNPPTEAPKPSSTEAPKPTDDIKIAPAPGGHHILGGIFIPTFLVLGFICGAFAIRKYDLIGKARELIRSRNQQQRYNGLMENEFDDDDPLLI
jgi:hypothetical protein